MSLEFMDGADKYGPPNTIAANVAALVTGPGAWTTASNVTLVTGLSTPGNALLIGASGFLNKTLSASHAQLIGGLRFNATALDGQSALMQFLDDGTAQSTITLETTGIIKLRTGGVAGAVIASGAVISAATTHVLGFDITFGASAAYQVWLDGVSLFSGTGNTKTTSNSTANGIKPHQPSAGSWSLDDLYVFNATDTMITGAPNNAALLTNPKVYEQFPSADSAVQFSPLAGVLGQAYSTVAATNAPGANTLFLRKFTPAVACTINSVACVPGATTAAKFRAVIYSDISGHAGSLLSSGTEVAGTTASTLLVGPLVTPQSLAAATSYWIGFVTDTTVALAQVDATSTGVKALNSYGSGAPSTAPAMGVGQPSWEIYGNLTGLAVNWAAVAQNPPLGDISAITDSTVGHQDLYTFPALPVTPDHIYAAGVCEYIRDSDTGTRTVDFRMKSNMTTVSGSNAGQTPAMSYSWLGSYFEEDPNTAGTAWTTSGLNAAKAGQKIAS